MEVFAFMKETNKKSVFIIMIGLILWILYLCDQEMSRYGIYTIISYNTHEILSAVPLLSFIITVVWLISKIAKSVREKNIKTQMFMCILLFILCVTQIIYIQNKYQTVRTTFATSIDRINREKMEIVIDTEEYNLTLYCPMIVLDTFKTDGTEYYITYEWNKKNPSYGKLCIVQ